jgi:hypothetical protein
VDADVDKMCRHAGYVVRSLGTELWTRLTESQAGPAELRKRDPPAVWKKNIAGISRLVIHNLYPQVGAATLWITELLEAGALTPPA